MCQLMLWHWQGSFFHLASGQLPGAATKTWMLFMLRPFPPHAQEYHLRDYYTTGVHPAAETGICGGTLGQSLCQMARYWGSNACRGEMNVMSSLFVSSAGGICQNSEWKSAFVNHLAAFNCANYCSSDANKQRLFTCRASLALRGQAQALLIFVDIWFHFRFKQSLVSD